MNVSSVISIGNLKAQRGQKVSGTVPIPADDGNGSAIPITIIHGINEGPTLLVLAGVHGSEYTPIVATQRLARDILELWRGALILVHMANLPSYLGRTVYKSPIDGKNLNRVFPGSRTGTLTERIADVLVEQVYPQANAVMDLHSGDANEALGPSYTAYYGKAGSPQVIQASKAMANAFGLDFVVEFQWEFGKDDENATKGAIWAGSAAVARGIPSIDVEMTPGKGLYDPVSIAQAYHGTLQVMDHLGLEPSFMAHPSNDNLPRTSEVCLVRERHFIEAPEGGSWVPLVDTGSFITQGTLLGYTTDLFGRNRTFEALAPADGLLLIRFEAPPVEKGDTLAVIAVLNSSDSGCDRFRLAPDALAAGCIVWQLAVAIGGWVAVLGMLLMMKGRARYSKHAVLPENLEDQYPSNQVV